MTLKEAQETFIDARGKSTEEWELACWKIGKAIMDGYKLVNVQKMVSVLENKKVIHDCTAKRCEGYNDGIEIVIQSLKECMR